MCTLVSVPWEWEQDLPQRMLRAEGKVGVRGRAERVTGRKARSLQMEEIACKCQTFYLS